MTQFYIHIGMHKTGTTSIQATFFNNRERLLENGINYLRIHQNHSEPLFSLFTDRPEKYHMNLRFGVDTPDKAERHNAGIRQSLMRELRDNRSKKLVISGEGLSMLSPAAVTRMKEALDPHAGSYRIIVYVREPYAFIQSAAQERLKAGVTLDALAGKPVLPRYRNRIEKYVEAFGRDNVDIRMFDPPRFVNGDLIGDFLSAIEEDPGLASRLDVVRANEAISYEAGLLLDQANNIYPRNADKTSNGQRASDLATWLARIEGETFVLPRSQLECLDGMIRNDVEWLHSVIGRPVFSAQLPEPPTVTPWQPETIRSLARLINDMAKDLAHKQAEIAVQRGHLALKTRKLRNAERHFREAVRLRPKDAAGYHQLSRIYARLGRLDDALDAARRAQELEPVEAYCDWLRKLEQLKKSRLLTLAHSAQRLFVR